MKPFRLTREKVDCGPEDFQYSTFSFIAGSFIAGDLSRIILDHAILVNRQTSQQLTWSELPNTKPVRGNIWARTTLLLTIKNWTICFQN